MSKTRLFAKTKSPSCGEVYVYEEIGDGWFGGITAQSFAEELKAVDGCKTLDVYINSPGGSVFDGLAIYNQLARMDAHIVMHVDGLAASIASVICMAGDEIRMSKAGMMMIHDPWGMAMGTADEMRKAAESLDKCKDSIVSVYCDRTKCAQKDVIDWMAAETWMTADDAMKRGFCDAIDENVGQPSNMAFAMLNKFRNVPKALRAQSRSASVAIARMEMRTSQIKR